MSEAVTMKREAEPLSAAVAELGRRYWAGDVDRARLDARLVELRAMPARRRGRSRSLPAVPPAVTFHSIESVSATQESL